MIWSGKRKRATMTMLSGGSDTDLSILNKLKAIDGDESNMTSIRADLERKQIRDNIGMEGVKSYISKLKSTIKQNIYINNQYI